MKKRGFTLLEVMIGVSLLALITIAILPSFSFSLKSESEIARRREIIMEAERIVERYKANYFEGTDLSLESSYSYSIDREEDEISYINTLKIEDGDYKYEITFYLPKEKGIYPY